MKILKAITQLLIVVLLISCGSKDKHVGYWLGKNSDDEVFGLHLAEDGKAIVQIGTTVYGPEIRRGGRIFELRYKIDDNPDLDYPIVEIAIYNNPMSQAQDFMICTFKFVDDKKALLIIFANHGNKWSEYQAIVTRVE
ncbi:MAG: hypothetical protein HND52_19805 [Ignavibacteriae bacterium]|nr:hypothetical protein [Ignavibacteriota bacterium]NOH00214.1 hypothetical protein [Ignavibacteriota bacterium]